MLTLRKVNFYFEKSRRVLEDISFEMRAGEILSIIGESGSGKSTLLKLIYGLEDVVSGEILFRSKKITGPKFNLVPGHPEMKFVPQEFDLLDSITVAENVGKYLSNFDVNLKSENISKALKVVQMEKFPSNFPSQLSGGQRQRVAIARAIAAKPKMLLLDEPYSHLDQPLKFELRKRIWVWARETGSMLILTTHDVNDALGFSDRVLILKEGQIIQNDAPENIRNQPENEYVASLLGEYSVLDSNQMKTFFQIETPQNKQAIIYPEEIMEDENGIEFQILDVRFRGRDYLIEAIRDDAALKFYTEKKPEKREIRLSLKNFRNI